MKKEASVQKLDQAADLLFLLEKLVDNASKEVCSTQEIPWSGIHLTLKRSRKLIQSTSEELLVALCSEALPYNRHKIASNRSSANGKSRSVLSGRIKKMPSFE